LKKEPEYAWLKEADSQALQQSLRDLDTAYQNFFRGHKPLSPLQKQI
jgi:putative transposase